MNRGQSLHSRLSERFFSHRRERPELSATGGEIHIKVAATQTCLHTLACCLQLMQMFGYLANLLCFDNDDYMLAVVWEIHDEVVVVMLK